MHRVATALAVLLLAACGSSTPSDAGLGTPTLVAGGQSTALPQAAAVIIASKSCSLSGFSANVGSVALAFSNHELAATRITDPCQAYASDILGFAAVVRINPLGGSADVGQGTYTISTQPDPVTLALAAGGFARTSATCAPVTSGVPQITGGKVVLTGVSATRVAGNVDLTLENGGTFKGGFDAPVLTVPGLDICALQTSGGAGVFPTCTSTVTCR